MRAARTKRSSWAVQWSPFRTSPTRTSTPPERQSSASLSIFPVPLHQSQLTTSPTSHHKCKGTPSTPYSQTLRTKLPPFACETSPADAADTLRRKHREKCLTMSMSVISELRRRKFRRCCRSPPALGPSELVMWMASSTQARQMRCASHASPRTSLPYAAANATST